MGDREKFFVCCYFCVMQDTIVAPASPRGVSAIAAVRVSGDAVKKIIGALFGKEEPENRKACYGVACHPETKEAIDSLVYIFFEGPRSYTGEDSLELYPHGNPLIVRELIMAICCVKGVRLALPGEFTRRAFLNGKLDLVQAEAVGDVIHSTTSEGLTNARRLLSGRFSTCVRDLSQEIRDMSARMELEVDFVEEEADADVVGWRTRFEKIQAILKGLLKNYRSAALENKLPRVVIYGAPNAGKSSLVNALLENERVLVSEIPGTTRDFVEAILVLPGGEIRLVDTAGIAPVAQDALDARSMAKSREVLESADLGVLLMEAAVALTEKGRSAIEAAKAKGHWVVFSKVDLAENFKFDNQGEVPQHDFLISVKTNQGLEALKNGFNEAIFPPYAVGEDFWITSERQRDCLQKADEGVTRILELINTNPAVELIAFELQIVRDSLASIIGEISSEDILQSIFSGFCIGK